MNPRLKQWIRPLIPSLTLSIDSPSLASKHLKNSGIDPKERTPFYSKKVANGQSLIDLVQGPVNWAPTVTKIQMKESQRLFSQSTRSVASRPGPLRWSTGHTVGRPNFWARILKFSELGSLMLSLHGTLGHCFHAYIHDKK